MTESGLDSQGTIATSFLLWRGCSVLVPLPTVQIAQDGEKKLREMSDRATIIAEKWRIKTQAPEPTSVKTESKSH